MQNGKTNLKHKKKGQQHESTYRPGHSYSFIPCVRCYAWLSWCSSTYGGLIMGNIEKYNTASDLRIAIEYYTELTVMEHQSGKMTKDADKAWKKVEKLINQLVEL